jgi:uncharacterized membrane protein YbaN (DUF454 family)
MFFCEHENMSNEQVSVASKHEWIFSRIFSLLENMVLIHYIFQSNLSKWNENYDLKISTTIFIKHPLPIVLCGLLVEVAHLFIHLNGMCAIIFETSSVPKS